jgi:hypothetical protein
MPCLPQSALIIHHNPLDSAEFWRPEPNISLKPNRIQPDLRAAAFSLNVHVRRLASVA